MGLRQVKFYLYRKQSKRVERKKKSDVTYATSRAPGGGAQNALCEYIWSARDKMIAG